MTGEDVANAYGVCPTCGAICSTRERRPDGNDKCVNGHVYPSRDAVRFGTSAGRTENEPQSNKTEP